MFCQLFAEKVYQSILIMKNYMYMSIYFKNRHIYAIFIFFKETFIIEMFFYISTSLPLSLQEYNTECSLSSVPTLYRISASFIQLGNWGTLLYITALVNVDRAGFSRDIADVCNKFREYFRDRSCSHKKERERKIFLFLALSSFSRRTRRYLLLSRGL